MTLRVLVIDDDRMMCQLLTEYLAPHGFEVVSSHTGEEGAARALSPGIDAVILDVMLPGIGGFEVIRKIRARSAVPVMMLTARAQEHERIAGLDAGADDYLSKTFSHRELLARLNALVRRTKAKDSTEIAEGGGIHVDAGKRVARRGTVQLHLTPAEFDILFALMKANGRVLTRERILQACERSMDVTDRAVDVHISSLRRKLGEDAAVIETVRSVGYRFGVAEQE